MARNSDEFLVAGVTDAYVGPVGSTMPADVTTAIDPAFTDLGFTTDDGTGFNVSYDVESRTSSQALDPTLRIRTGRDITITVGLQQFNDFNVPLALGGGTVAETTPGSGVWKYDAPAASVIDYRALVLHTVNGDKIGRILIPKVMVTETDDLSLVKESEVILAITFGVIASSAAPPFSIIGNADFFSVAA